MEEMKLVSDCYGAHNNQVVTMVATVGTLKVGDLRYSVFGGKLYINSVWVLKKCRRQGIATKMLRQMETDNPGCSVSWGVTTGAGTKLKASYVASCNGGGNNVG